METESNIYKSFREFREANAPEPLKKRGGVLYNIFMGVAAIGATYELRKMGLFFAPIIPAAIAGKHIGTLFSEAVFFNNWRTTGKFHQWIGDDGEGKRHLIGGNVRSDGLILNCGEIQTQDTDLEEYKDKKEASFLVSSITLTVGKEKKFQEGYYYLLGPTLDGKYYIPHGRNIKDYEDKYASDHANEK